jgi:tetratricopeptide (TPR) repeat protein
MRSTYKIPESVRFYPHYLRQAGYYTTNNSKKDYNTIDQPEVWNESSRKAHYSKRAEGQPFFHVVNFMTTHESRLHWDSIASRHDPNQVEVPPFQINSPEMRNDHAVLYDRMQDMDAQAGEVLRRLEEEGLAENTIVFYYSDHGGATGGTKRFLTQSGLHVPLIVYVPPRYRHLTDFEPGSVVEQPVTFVDLPATLLQLAGLELPEHMVGKSVLKKKEDPDPAYAFSFAGRMDERPNMVRSVTDGQYRFTRNYKPHLPYGQKLSYLWRAPGMRSWAEAYEQGELDSVQRTFFEPRPATELYDITRDPYQIHNLSGQAEYAAVEKRLSRALINWQVETRDAGLIPELMLVKLDQFGLIHNYNHSADYALEEALELARRTGERNPDHLPLFVRKLNSEDPVIRYWAAMGLRLLGSQAAAAQTELVEFLPRAREATGIVIAETLYLLGEHPTAFAYLQSALQDDELMKRVYALNVINRWPGLARDCLPILQKMTWQKSRKEPYDQRLVKNIFETLDQKTTLQ